MKKSRFLSFIVLLIILITSCYEFRFQAVEKRAFDLEQNNIVVSKALVEILRRLK